MNNYLNKVLHGDCIEIMKQLPDDSIDSIFADPPYNLQLKRDLYINEGKYKVHAVTDDWDKFEQEEYDQFTIDWLTEAKRILKPTGTTWVCGSYHNIFRVGYIMQNLGFWFLNDIQWIKTNPMPNFNGTRFQSAVETIIWAKKQEKGKYVFNYRDMKSLNEDKQMRNDWYIANCNSPERIKNKDGSVAHKTQKPEALLFRIVIAASNPGDIILDPFGGSGTTAAVAKKLGRQYITIEKEEKYIKIIEERLSHVMPLPDVFDISVYAPNNPKAEKRVPIGNLIETNLISIGETFYNKKKDVSAVIKHNGNLLYEDTERSIHKTAAYIKDAESENGWEYWYVERDGVLTCIKDLRATYRENEGQA